MQKVNFISREQVIEIVKNDKDMLKKIESLFSFPAPNPDWRGTGRNIMGQTEEEFWALVDK